MDTAKKNPEISLSTWTTNHSVYKSKYAYPGLKNKEAQYTTLGGKVFGVRNLLYYSMSAACIAEYVIRAANSFYLHVPTTEFMLSHPIQVCFVTLDFSEKSPH